MFESLYLFGVNLKFLFESFVSLYIHLNSLSVDLQKLARAKGRAAISITLLFSKPDIGFYHHLLVC